jgi:hypothetical protein
MRTSRTEPPEPEELRTLHELLNATAPSSADQASDLRPLRGGEAPRRERPANRHGEGPSGSYAEASLATQEADADIASRAVAEDAMHASQFFILFRQHKHGPGCRAHEGRRTAIDHEHPSSLTAGSLSALRRQPAPDPRRRPPGLQHVRTDQTGANHAADGSRRRTLGLEHCRQNTVLPVRPAAQVGVPWHGRGLETRLGGTQRPCRAGRARGRCREYLLARRAPSSRVCLRAAA